MAGAVAVGAKVEIETMPGYLPTIPVDAPEELVEAAKLAAGDKYNVNVVDATSTPSGGSTDVGDVQHLQPVFTFNTGGAVGSGLHSVDFDVNDEELAYIVTAKIFALTAYRLLKGGAVAAKKLVDDYKPIFTKQEYIDFMEEIGGSATGKSLPVSNFVGYQVSGFPHFRNYPNGQGFLVTHLGFYFWKYYNRHVDNMALRSSTVDYLLFGIEEVMLNYAEAKFELGEFSQSVADATINKLRVRAVIPAMNVSEIDASFDLNRDLSVDPVLWEIRRERRIELMGDGFRFRDLKRWKKGENVNKQPLGAWVKSSDYGSKLNILGGADEGYSILFAKPSGWLEKYYLEPIPTQEIALNPKLKQNPGWETAE